MAYFFPSPIDVDKGEELCKQVDIRTDKDDCPVHYDGDPVTGRYVFSSALWIAELDYGNLQLIQRVRDGKNYMKGSKSNSLAVSVRFPSIGALYQGYKSFDFRA